ncbi:MAG TPA: SAM-dependent methyltransferase [Caulobacteraceae bacterium]
MNLRDRLAALIAARGPMPISTYSDICLHDPTAGYYATRPRLGERGDFITAPHISQMFGEMLALWAIELWERLGRPAQIRLIELGPGDATMIGDVLRAARAAPAFLGACDVWLVETSAPLKRLQRAALAAAPAPVRWVDEMDAVPTDVPLIVVANEFLDCLPVEQYVRADGAWRERLVGVDAAGRLRFQMAAACDLPAGPRRPGAADGSLLESSSALAAFGTTIGAAVTRAGGAALFIDYGRDGPGFGDTLQALRGHANEHPLANPGEADLTAHVDFPAFLDAGRKAGAAISPVRTQGEFLRELGIETRAAILAQLHPQHAKRIARQLDRLIGPKQMGSLFKAACLHSAGLSPPGFGGPP